MYCSACGNKISENSKFCSMCGKPVEKANLPGNEGKGLNENLDDKVNDGIGHVNDKEAKTMTEKTANRKPVKIKSKKGKALKYAIVIAVVLLLGAGVYGIE